MSTNTRRFSGARGAAIAISCTALVAVAIGPAFASSRAGASGATPTGSTDLVRLRHLEAETVGADADELAELNGMIEPDDQAQVDQTEATDPPELETPEPIETPDPTEAPHAKPKPASTSTAGEETDDQGETNDDQGENEQDHSQSGPGDTGTSGHHSGGDSGQHDGGDSGGD